MQSSLRRWFAAALPLAVFAIAGVLVVRTWSQPEPAKPAQPASPSAKVAEPVKPAQPPATHATSAKVAEPAKAAQPAGIGLPSWSTYGGGPSRNMVNTTAKNLPIDWNTTNPTKNVLWSAELGSRAYGGPIVAGGKVFVGTNNEGPRDPKYVKTVEVDGKQTKVPVDLGVLMCFDQLTGKFLYQTVFPKLGAGRVADWPREGFCSTPTVEGDRIYYTSNRCEIVCAKIDTGEFIWKLDMYGDLGVRPHNMSDCSPLVVGDYLYVVTSNGVDDSHLNVPAPEAPSFLKISKKDGKVIWKDNSPTVKLTQIAKGGQDVFKNLVNRGELVQHGQWSNPAYAVVNGQPQVIFPAGDGWIRSFDPDGKLLWKFDCNPKDALYELGSKGTRSDFIATPVIYKNRVYIGTGQDPEHEAGVGHLWCIDMDKRGDVSPDLVTDWSVWPPKTKPNPNSAKVWHLGGLVKEEDKAKVGRNYYFGRTMSTCAIYDDLVYASDWEGFVYCLDANTGKIYWQHDTQSTTWSAPLWADNKVYLGTDEGEIWIFAHGKEKKLLGHPDVNTYHIRAAPVAAGEVLYVIAGNQIFALANKK